MFLLFFLLGDGVFRPRNTREKHQKEQGRTEGLRGDGGYPDCKIGGSLRVFEVSLSIPICFSCLEMIGPMYHYTSRLSFT